MMSSCARQEGLQGGPKDTEAPQVVWSKSSPNLQTGSKPREIKLTFNEWISLNNIQGQHHFTPSLDYKPEFKLKGKTLWIQLDEKEELKDSTTYLFFPGESIQDITEKNLAKNIQFVFSTGDHIDSLWIEGYVINALELNPVKDAIVGLYFNLADTAFRKTKPDFLIKTDDQGYFKISYLKPGRYALYALKDNNQNNYFDLASEEFAFLPQAIDLRKDSTRSYKLLISANSPTVRISQKEIQSGLVKIKFTGTVNNLIWQTKEQDKTFWVHDGDSLMIWYESKDTLTGFLSYDDQLDTIFLPPSEWNKNIKDGFAFKIKRFILKPDEPFILEAPYPIKNIVQSKIKMSSHTEFLTMKDSMKPNVILVQFRGVMNEPIAIEYEDGFVELINGEINRQDSIVIRKINKESLSGLNLKVDQFESGKKYILRLIKGKTMIQQEFIHSDGTPKEFKYTYLDPGKYMLQIIEDSNGNGVWDPGDLDKKLQPETVRLYELEELRPDWDVEQTIKMD